MRNGSATSVGAERWCGLRAFLLGPRWRLGMNAATWSRDGQPLLPVGTIYDPFVARALEPWSFGIYAGGQSILVGTPSGVTLGPEGGAPPVGHHAVDRDRAAGPRAGAAFGRDLEWTLLHAAVAARPLGRHVGVLPALDAADRPGAAHGHARGGAGRRLRLRSPD